MPARLKSILATSRVRNRFPAMDHTSASIRGKGQMLHRRTDSLGHREHYLPKETFAAAASACAGRLGRAKLKFHEMVKIASAKLLIPNENQGRINIEIRNGEIIIALCTGWNELKQF